MLSRLLTVREQFVLAALAAAVLAGAAVLYFIDRDDSRPVDEPPAETEAAVAAIDNAPIPPPRIEPEPMPEAVLAKPEETEPKEIAVAAKGAIRNRDFTTCPPARWFKTLSMPPAELPMKRTSTTSISPRPS